MSSKAVKLSSREVAYGFVTGRGDVSRLPDLPPDSVPIEALERAVLPALQRTPCMVEFSGGRDSSAILAVATRVARREGLALPIPITMFFPGASASGETDWQQRVVEHLALDRWEQIEAGAQLDLIGPIAARGLRRHGLLWPANTHSHVPLLERASGGSLLTGIDGDAVFGTWEWGRVAAVLRGRAAPTRHDLRQLARGLAPASLRSWRAGRRVRREASGRWLVPDVREAWWRELSTEGPRRWKDHIGALASSRYVEAMTASMAALAEDAGTLLVHPFLDRGFLATLRSAGGSWGWGDRTAMTAALFSGLLPEQTVRRESKATFDEVFWTAATREFARAWDGSGVDLDFIDPDGLREEWLSDSPDARTSTLLQSAWLHADAQTTDAHASAGGSGDRAAAEDLASLAPHARTVLASAAIDSSP